MISRDGEYFTEQLEREAFDYGHWGDDGGEGNSRMGCQESLVGSGAGQRLSYIIHNNTVSVDRDGLQRTNGPLSNKPSIFHSPILIIAPLS